MKIYLDTCTIQRPLDNKSQIRIVLEAEAVLGILSFCESGDIDLVSSEALLFETNRNPSLTRKEFAVEVLSKAKLFVSVNDQVEKRARTLIAMGIKPLDALHLALAEQVNVDYFCTCDDGLLKKTKSTSINIKVISPIDLIEELVR